MSDNSDKGGKRPGGNVGPPPVAREKLPTLTNAKELEAALKKSMELLPSSAPSPKTGGTASRPPPPLVLGEFTDLDKGWGDDDLDDDDSPATARVSVPEVPGGTPAKRPGGRRSSKMRAAATPAAKPNEVPTAPPPVGAPPAAAAMPTPAPGAPAQKVLPPLAPPPLPPPPALETFDLTDDTAQELGVLPPKVPEPPPTKPRGVGDLPDEEPDPGRKSFPSTRSLVSGLDEDALVSSLFDDEAPPPLVEPLPCVDAVNVGLNGRLAHSAA